ncbi:MAG: D-alanyl-D-alanine carboxypeptidase [Ktedonobacteraceae bacterium]|nr:D-alanyl-D-alanine carboxypeptidase [Ktedonobacteraceae bacterium]
MIRRSLAITLMTLALCVAIAASLLAFIPHKEPVSASQRQTPATTIPELTQHGPPPTTNAFTAYLVDADTSRVLTDSNGEKPLSMASTTKIMTALIAIQTGDLDQLVTIKQDAYDEVHLYAGSSANLVVGDQLPLRDLIYGLMLPSGDDAAIAIADALAQTPANFAQRMNLFALRLHLFQTHYTNPDGLTPDGNINSNHYTTAADLVHLTNYAMTLPLFRQVVQTQRYIVAPTAQTHAYTWDNTNKLLQIYPGATGTKTGYTQEAGYCLVFSATHANHHLVGVLLDDTDSDHRFHDAITLLNWGFGIPNP